MPGAHLSALPIPFLVRFGSDPIPSPVAAVAGLGAAEGWGRWNIDGRIGIRFEGDLPADFEAHIACAVAPANLGRVITLMAGGCVRSVVSVRTLTHGLEVAKVGFHTAYPARTLEIFVPGSEPASPLDIRALGFALSSLAIVAPGGDAHAAGGREHG